MGPQISHFCGCKNSSDNQEEVNMISRGVLNNSISKIISNRNSEKNICRITYPDKTERESPAPDLKLIEKKIKANKIIRAYREYKKRSLLCIVSAVSSSLSSNPNKGLLAKNSFSYRGGKNSRNQKEGFGVKKWSNGTKYIGNFSDDVAKGWGILKHFEGDQYRGQFDKDQANGYGEYTDREGVKYCGMWLNDNKNGIGYEEWEDSSKYSGMYLDGKRNGIGTYIWNNKSKYQGEWRDNNIEGYGIYYFSDGKVYIGEWMNNQIHGYGEMTWKEGRKYYGFFRYDKKSGFGIYQWGGEKIYMGFWKDGKQHGLGKYIKNDVAKYGVWKDGKKEKWLSDYTELQSVSDPRDEKFLEMFQMTGEEIKKFLSEGVNID